MTGQSETPAGNRRLQMINVRPAANGVQQNGSSSSTTATTTNQQEEANPPMVPYTKLFCTADRLDFLMMALGAVGAAANGACWPVFAIIFGQFSDTFGDPSNSNFLHDVSTIALYFVYTAIAAFVGSFFQTAMWMWTGNRQTSRLRLRYLTAVLCQDVAFFDTQATTGALLQGLNDDSETVSAAISEKVGHFIQHSCTFITGLVIAFWRGWDMTLVMLGCLPFLAAVGGVLAMMSTRLTSKAQQAYTDASSIAEQSMSQIRTVVSYGAEEKEIEAYTKALAMPLQVGLRQSLYMGLGLGSVNCVMYLTYAVAFYYGAWRASTGAYSGGDVFNVVVAALVGGFSLGQAAPVLQNFAKGKVAGARMFSVIERPPAIDVSADGRVLDQVQGTMELRDVMFAYPARPDILVFNGFNLTVPAGKTVALVGGSGSGKSTVVQLLERFYDPAAGMVLLDGVNIRALKLTWYRMQVGLVSQEPTLFATTIYENIAMGREGATQQEVEQAALAANAHAFISMLPLGYETNVGERGLQLSGGQKQRIAIARAILKNPKILLLDEATSALDTESERLVQDALNRMIVGRTTVVVAHRLSTVQDADTIAVIASGSVVEMGTHDELIANPIGAYSTLVKLQMQEEEEKERQGGPATIQEGDVEEVDLIRIDKGDVAVPQQALEHLSADIRVRTSAVARQLDTDTAADLEAKPKEVNVPFSRLLKMNRPEYTYLAFGIISSAAAGVVQPAFSIVISSMIYIFYDGDQSGIRHRASFWSWMFFVIGMGSLAATTCQQWSFGVMGQQLARRIRISLFRAIMYQEVGWFDLDQHSSGVLTSKLASEASLVRGAVGDTIALMLQNFFCLAFGFLIAFIFDWRMALVVTGALPFMVSGTLIYYRTIAGADSGTSAQFASANQAVSDAFSSIRVVHAYNLHGKVRSLYKHLVSNANTVMRKRSLLTGVMMGYSQFSIFATYGLIIWFGGLEVDSGRASFDQMLKAFLAILLAAIGLAQASIGFPDVGKAKGAVQSVFPIIDRKSTIDASSTEGMVPPGLEGRIELQDVKFVYPARPTVVVFRGFNLDIPAGKTVALVGESGSGKSTIVGLVERFYDVVEGAVLIDGVDIRRYHLGWLRSQIGLVSQEPLLFSGTILDNIRYGRPDATLEEVTAVAQAANAHEFIDKLPDGYYTKVGERGIQLSGGQKQRVAIARAVVKNPRILLLDEATSALDAQSEQVVQNALDNIMQGRTSVVIAHRLTTIRHADKIALVYRGAILEQGTHEELMALPDGGYARLVAAQQGAKSRQRTLGGSRGNASFANLASSSFNDAPQDT